MPKIGRRTFVIQSFPITVQTDSLGIHLNFKLPDKGEASRPESLAPFRQVILRLCQGRAGFTFSMETRFSSLSINANGEIAILNSLNIN